MGRASNCGEESRPQASGQKRVASGRCKEECRRQRARTAGRRRNPLAAVCSRGQSCEVFDVSLRVRKVRGGPVPWKTSRGGTRLVRTRGCLPGLPEVLNAESFLTSNPTDMGSWRPPGRTMLREYHRSKGGKLSGERHRVVGGRERASSGPAVHLRPGEKKSVHDPHNLIY